MIWIRGFHDCSMNVGYRNLEMQEDIIGIIARVSGP